jgi:PBSX family phage portal protein
VTQEIEVSLGRPKRRTLVAESTDPFKRSGEDLLKMGGLNPAVRRRLSRHIEKAFVSEDGKAKSKQLNPYVVIDAYSMFGVILPPYNLDYLSKIYEMSPPHYAAVKAKVMNIVGLGYDFVPSPKAQLKLENTTSDRTKKSIQANIRKERQALLDWLDDCNQEDEFVETLIKVWTDYETLGNGYLEIGRGLDGSIKYIGHIPAALMRIRRDRDGFVQIFSNQAVFFRNFGDKTTEDKVGNDPTPNEVIHLKKYSPTHTYYGIPDIIAAQQAIAGNEFSARFNLDYFENKAVPRYVIVLKGASFSEQAQQNLLEFFETGLKGQNHRTLFVPLPPNDSEQQVDFEMKPVEAGAQDSSFMNYRRGNLDEILMAHRVPITKVGTSEGVNLANAVDMDKTFKEQVCRPEQDILEKKLNKIIKEMTDVLVINLNELTLTDENTQSQIDQRELQSGITVPNEVRARKGLPAREGGDAAMVLSAKDQMDQQQATLDSAERQQQAQIKAQTANAKLQAETARHSASQQARVGVAQAKAGVGPNGPAPAGQTANGSAASQAKKPAQARADRANNAKQSDARAQSRSTGADKNGTGRNPKGAGRKTQ